LKLGREQAAQHRVDLGLGDETIAHGDDEIVVSAAAVEITAQPDASAADSAALRVTPWWLWKSSIAPQSLTKWPENFHAPRKVSTMSRRLAQHGSPSVAVVSAHHGLDAAHSFSNAADKFPRDPSRSAAHRNRGASARGRCAPRSASRTRGS